MNRRAFFRTMVGGIAATAAVRTWPFRVFSFPSEILLGPALPSNEILYGGARGGGKSMTMIYGALQEQVAILPSVMKLFDAKPPKWLPEPSQIRFLSMAPYKVME